MLNYTENRTYFIFYDLTILVLHCCAYGTTNIACGGSGGGFATLWMIFSTTDFAC